MLMILFFGSTNEEFCKEFGDLMSKEFEMSMIGDLSFFLRFQVKQMEVTHLTKLSIAP